MNSMLAHKIKSTLISTITDNYKLNESETGYRGFRNNSSITGNSAPGRHHGNASWVQPSRGPRVLTLGSPSTRLNMKCQVSRSHMQVLETTAGDKYLCSRKEISRKPEFLSTGGCRSKSLERGKRDMDNVAETLNFNTRHYQSSQVNRTKQVHLVQLMGMSHGWVYTMCELS